GGVLSWDRVVRTPISHNQLANAVPGALAVYDLPDLAAALAPRKLTIRNPVDTMGQPAPQAAVEETYQPVRAAYEKVNGKDKWVTGTEGKCQPGVPSGRARAGPSAGGIRGTFSAGEGAQHTASPRTAARPATASPPRPGRSSRAPFRRP